VDGVIIWLVGAGFALQLVSVVGMAVLMIKEVFDDGKEEPAARMD